MGKKKKAASDKVTLSYPLPIREEREKIARTLFLAKEVANVYLSCLYEPEILDLLSDGKKKAYKVLEPILGQKAGGRIPSRVNRGILEIVGRTLRAVNERRKLFEALLQLDPNPERWDYRRLVAEKKIHAKSQHVRNLAEQARNYRKSTGEMPESYFHLQPCPRVRKPVLSYAPDDGQAIRIEKKDGHLEIHMKVLASCEEGNVVWEWVKVHVPLPERLQNIESCAPDLRLVNLHGSDLPVFDYKVRIASGPGGVLAPVPGSGCPKKRFLTVDWGTRKLIALCVFDEEGNQISVPVFVDFEPIQKKLLRIREEIDRLKSLRDQLPYKSSGWRKHNREIARRWRKFRALGKALAHLAANVIVLVAQIYECDRIHVEWLKSLKSKKFGRLLNWIVNTTVRQKIYDLVRYKARLVGIELQKPIPPAYTSQYCPKCGRLGHHAPSSDRRDEKKASGGWFVCPHCHFNCDRDYAACLNLARKVLYGNSLNHDKKTVYRKVFISDLLSRQSSWPPRQRLLHNVKGWRKLCKTEKKGAIRTFSVFVSCSYFFTGLKS